MNNEYEKAERAIRELFGDTVTPSEAREMLENLRDLIAVISEIQRDAREGLYERIGELEQANEGLRSDVVLLMKERDAAEKAREGMVPAEDVKPLIKLLHGGYAEYCVGGVIDAALLSLRAKHPELFAT